MSRINLIAWTRAGGLRQDVEMLRQTLVKLGHEVSVMPVGPPRTRSRLAAWRQRLRMRWVSLRSGGRIPARFDLNITLEHTQPDYLGLARRNAFISNPEWLSRRDRRRLHRYDAIFAKTREGCRVLEGLGPTVHHIGFTSPDCREEVSRERAFLHLAGASPTKGTDRLIALWLKHPDWPLLRVLQAPGRASPWPSPMPANVQHRVEFVADLGEIRHLQNAHVFHLCLSETEGWGHYLVEAMSCGAMVATCDAPPMNELVRPDRGVLIRAHKAGTLNVAQLYHADEASLESAIERMVGWSEEQIETMRQGARTWFEDNDRGFPSRLDAAVRNVLDHDAAAGRSRPS